MNTTSAACAKKIHVSLLPPGASTRDLPPETYKLPFVLQLYLLIDPLSICAKSYTSPKPSPS